MASLRVELNFPVSKPNVEYKKTVVGDTESISRWSCLRTRKRKLSTAPVDELVKQPRLPKIYAETGVAPDHDQEQEPRAVCGCQKRKLGVSSLFQGRIRCMKTTSQTTMKYRLERILQSVDRPTQAVFEYRCAVASPDDDVEPSNTRPENSTEPQGSQRQMACECTCISCTKQDTSCAGVRDNTSVNVNPENLSPTEWEKFDSEIKTEPENSVSESTDISDAPSHIETNFDGYSDVTVKAECGADADEAATDSSIVTKTEPAEDGENSGEHVSNSSLYGERTFPIHSNYINFESRLTTPHDLTLSDCTHQTRMTGLSSRFKERIECMKATSQTTVNYNLERILRTNTGPSQVVFEYRCAVTSPEIQNRTEQGKFDIEIKTEQEDSENGCDGIRDVPSNTKTSVGGLSDITVKAEPASRVCEEAADSSVVIKTEPVEDCGNSGAHVSSSLYAQTESMDSSGSTSNHQHLSGMKVRLNQFLMARKLHISNCNRAYETQDTDKARVTKRNDQAHVTKRSDKACVTKCSGEVHVTKYRGKACATKPSGKTHGTKLNGKACATRQSGKAQMTKHSGKVQMTKHSGKAQASKCSGKSGTFQHGNITDATVDSDTARVTIHGDSDIAHAAKRRKRSCVTKHHDRAYNQFTHNSVKVEWRYF